MARQFEMDRKKLIQHTMNGVTRNPGETYGQGQQTFSKNQPQIFIEK